MKAAARREERAKQAQVLKAQVELLIQGLHDLERAHAAEYARRSADASHLDAEVFRLFDARVAETGTGEMPESSFAANVSAPMDELGAAKQRIHALEDQLRSAA